MKYVKKGKVPKPLKGWIKMNKNLPGAQYGSLGFPTADVRDALLNEQGKLCAYTMVPLSTETCHVEHIKPQELSRAEQSLHETWDYNNLLACYPGDDPHAAGRDQFGATKKGSNWDEQYFVSPLQGACESHFRFTSDGAVSPSRSNDHAAAWTIDTLGLDCEILAEWRRAAIEAFGVSLTSATPLKRSQADQLRTAIRKRRADGTFNGYCVAVEHAAEAYIAMLDKIAKNKKFAGRSRAKKGR